MIQMKALKILAAVAAFSLLALTAGCDSGTAANENSAPQQAKQTQPAAVQDDSSAATSDVKTKQQTLTVYFPNANGDKLIAV